MYATDDRKKGKERGMDENEWHKWV